MERIKYFDFDILIERVNERYRARVIQSPAGQASAEFVLPFTDQDIEILMLRVGRARRGVRRIESPEMQAAKQFGGKLFDAVFAGDVRGALRSSADSANREGAGLRVRLRLADTPELVDLPWEFLYNASLNRFLALSNKTPLVRYIELPETPRPLKVMPPLRVLVMISSPSDYEGLDVEREWQNLNNALSELIAGNLVTLERLDSPTLGALRRKLRQGQYHVLQFIGHGGFDAQAQDGVLMLEDEQGRGRRASGQYLGTVLTDHDSLRLVVLNACEGARTARSDPFAGVAQSLVQQGIPAVIAMQFEVTDEAAIIFAHEFYSALADGYPVDAALGDARGAIFAQVNDLEWGTPVLYLRAPDGMIFAPLTAQERAELERARLAEEQRVREQQEQARLAQEQRVREEQALEQDRLAQEQRGRERQQQIETLYLAAKSSFEKKDFDAAEKSLVALFALDATNENARALQTEIKTERERITREQAAQAAALTVMPERAQVQPSSPTREQAEAARTTAPTAIPERAPLQAASAPSTPQTSGSNRMLLIGGGLAALLVLFLGGAYGLGVFNPRTPTLTPPPIETFLPPTVPTKGGGILPTPVTSPQIGTIEQRGNDNAEMVFVPAGEFLMGSGANESGASHEKPQHTVILDAFWIDRHEVTIAQYSLCVDAGKCKPPEARHSLKRGAYYGVAQFDNYPVIDVTWADAQNYCTWAGKRLPTEAKWEKAARGTDGRIYPWGNDFEQSRVNNNEVVGDTTEVGSYPNGASPYGALDMAGNVWEYVNDWYGERYYSNSPRTNPTGPPSGVYRVRRGGAMLNAQNNVRAAERNAVALDYHDFQNGFRCAQSAQTASETSAPPTTVIVTSIDTPQPSPTSTLIPFERPTLGKIVFLGGVQGSNTPLLMLYDVGQDSLTNIRFDTSRFQDQFFNAPALSHDGRKVALVGLMPGSKFRVATMNVDGTELRVLNLEGNYSDQAPAWSHDDTQIAFATNRNGNFEIYAMDADGTNARRLTKTLSESTNPSWSPDDSKIVYADSATGSLGLYTIGADGQGANESLVVEPASEITDPVWSPDGGRIAFTARSRLQDWSLVRIYDLEERQILTLPCPSQKFCTTPTWSPDSAHIAFVATDSHAEQNGDIYYTRPTGKHALYRFGSEINANIFRPSWSR